jgi:hypothetical protein
MHMLTLLLVGLLLESGQGHVIRHMASRTHTLKIWYAKRLKMKSNRPILHQAVGSAASLTWSVVTANPFADALQTPSPPRLGLTTRIR